MSRFLLMVNLRRTVRPLKNRRHLPPVKIYLHFTALMAEYLP